MSLSTKPKLWYGIDLTSRATIDEVGGKGFSLIHCKQGGFQVPDGFVLTVSFFNPWLRLIQETKEYKKAFEEDSAQGLPPREDCDKVKEKCLTLTLNKDQQAALDVALYAVFDESTKLCSVRSSSPQEDSAHASLAGIYHTTLGVSLDEKNELLEALKASFASVFDYRVACITIANGGDMDCRLAVVIQTQLDSQSSGVAFSLNPQNNCYDEVVITANHGLGETVVAGVVTPDTYIVDKVENAIVSKKISKSKNIASFLRKESGRGVIDIKIEDSTIASLLDEQALLVSQLASSVEKYIGAPVDIEWSFDKEKLFLLQARPITTYFAMIPEMLTEPGYTKHLYLDVIVNSQGFSESMSVLGLDVWGSMFRSLKEHMKPGPDGTIWEIWGRQYFVLSNILSMPSGRKMLTAMMEANGGYFTRLIKDIDLNSYTPSKTPDKMKVFFWGSLTEIFETMLFTFRAWLNPEKEMDAYFAVSDDILEKFRRGGLEDSRVDVTFGDAVGQFIGPFSQLIKHFGVVNLCFYAKWRLEKIFENDVEAGALIPTLTMDVDFNPTSEMGHDMLRLASFSEFQNTKTGEEFLQKLNEKSYSQEFLDAYDDHITKFGCRGIKEIDIATPRSYENQADLFRRIKQINLESHQITAVKQRKEDAYNALLAKASLKGKADSFRHHARTIQKFSGLREHPKYLFVFIVACLRRRALRIAERFLKEGRLEHTSDIFYLSIEEITKAEITPDMSLSPLVSRAKTQYEKLGRVKEWPQIFDSRGKILRSTRQDVTDGIGGDPISPGKVVGRARVLFSPFEKPLQPGEILVTKATEPSWTPLFLNASGVILEVGGPLQHGAIIAREYGIPAVSGIDNVTDLIKDGQMVEVDGTNGIIRILKSEDVSAEST